MSQRLLFSLLLLVFFSLSLILFNISVDSLSLSKSNIIDINAYNNMGSPRDYFTTISNISNDRTINNSIVEKEGAEPSHVYINSTYGIKIKYPAGWIVEESDAATIFHNQSKSLNVVAEILTPIQSSYYDSKIGASHNSIRLIVEDYNTFGNYVNENIQNYINKNNSKENNNNKLLTIANKRIGAIGLYCHNFDLQSWNQNASLAGYPAHQIFLDYSYDKYSKDATEIWTIKNDKIYIIEFVAQDTYYTQYLPIVNKILNSFRIFA